MSSPSSSPIEGRRWKLHARNVGLGVTGPGLPEGEYKVEVMPVASSPPPSPNPTDARKQLEDDLLSDEAVGAAYRKLPFTKRAEVKRAFKAALASLNQKGGE